MSSQRYRSVSSLLRRSAKPTCKEKTKGKRAGPNNAAKRETRDTTEAHHNLEDRGNENRDREQKRTVHHERSILAEGSVFPQCHNCSGHLAPSSHVPRTNRHKATKGMWKRSYSCPPPPLSRSCNRE